MIPNIDSNFPNPKNLITLIDNNIIKHSPIFQTQNQNILQIPTHPHPMIVPHSQPLKITTLQKPILIKNFPEVNFNKISGHTKNIQCQLKEGYLYYIKPKNFLDNNFMNLDAQEIFQVKLSLNLEYLSILVNDINEILRINLNEIQAVKKSYSENICFEIFDFFNKKFEFCQMENPEVDSANEWVDDIIKFKSYCRNINGNDYNVSVSGNELNHNGNVNNLNTNNFNNNGRKSIFEFNMENMKEDINKRNINVKNDNDKDNKKDNLQKEILKKLNKLDMLMNKKKKLKKNEKIFEDNNLNRNNDNINNKNYNNNNVNNNNNYKDS